VIRVHDAAGNVIETHEQTAISGSGETKSCHAGEALRLIVKYDNSRVRGQRIAFLIWSNRHTCTRTKDSTSKDNSCSTSKSKDSANPNMDTTPVVRVTKSTGKDESPTAAPVTAAPVSGRSSFDIFPMRRGQISSRLGSLVSASRRYRAKMFAMRSAVSAMSRLNSADGDGDGENNQKERFHSNKVSSRPAATTQNCRPL
jgi:hypothetical protein